MLGLYVRKLKEFNRRLFLEDSFDRFLVSSARFATDCTVSFDGSSLSRDSSDAYVHWAQIKPVAAQLVRGKAPGSFQIVLILPKEKTAALLAAAGWEAAEDELPLLFLNLQYRQEQMTLTTGISEKTFGQFPGLSSVWDKTVPALLSDMGLSDSLSE